MLMKLGERIEPPIEPEKVRERTDWSSCPFHAEVDVIVDWPRLYCDALAPPRSSRNSSSSSSTVSLGPSVRVRCCASKSRIAVSGALESVGRSTEKRSVRLG